MVECKGDRIRREAHERRQAHLQRFERFRHMGWAEFVCDAEGFRWWNELLGLIRLPNQGLLARRRELPYGRRFDQCESPGCNGKAADAVHIVPMEWCPRLALSVDNAAVMCEDCWNRYMADSDWFDQIRPELYRLRARHKGPLKREVFWDLRLYYRVLYGNQAEDMLLEDLANAKHGGSVRAINAGLMSPK